MSDLSQMRVAFMALNSYPLFFKEPVPAGGAEVQQYYLVNSLQSEMDIAVILGDFGQRAIEERNGILFIKTPSPPGGLSSPGGFIGGIYPHGLYRLVALAEYNPQKWLSPLAVSLHRAMNMADADIYFQMIADWTTVEASRYCRSMDRRFVFATASDEDCTLDYRTPAMRKRIKRGILAADAVIVQTEKQKELIYRNMGVDARVVPSIWPAVDNIPDEDGDYILWAGRIDANKRPEVVVRLAEKLPHVKFVMVGYPGDRDLYERVKRSASHLENLDFRGYVPFDETKELFRGCRALLNTSIVEGVPNTFFQAWEYGRPVVTLGVDPDGVMEIDGAGASAKTFEELVMVIEDLWSSPENYRKMGLSGRRILEKRHSPEKVIPMYTDIFTSLSP